MLNELQNERTNDLSSGPELFTIPQAASWLSCSTRTVKRRIADGSLAVVRIGPGQRDRRITAAALSEFVATATEAGEAA